MDKLTKKEEIIVKLLVKKNSKDELEEFINDYIIHNELPELLTTMIKMVQGESNVKTIVNELSIQYLQYATLFYEDILEDNLTNDIERVKTYTLTKETTESEIEYRNYYVNFNITPSLLKRKTESIKDNFWNSNFDSDTIDYGDTDVIEEKYDEPQENERRKLSSDKIN
jgi:hypothetical protein